MAGLFKKIAKWALIGGGSILSFINPMLGAPLIVAGTAIKVDNDQSADIVSQAAGNLVLGLNTAGSMQAAGNRTIATTGILDWIKANLLIVIVGIFGIVLLFPKIFKKRR